jgi:DNA-binding response OmpR family regulator
MINVFVVDDDDELLEMVTLMLQANGMRVESFHTGESLRESLGASSPDVLLMDIFLGDGDGREFCREVKTGAGYNGFPVILYSAGDIPTASVADAGADFFMRKPFNMSELVGHIRERTAGQGR